MPYLNLVLMLALFLQTVFSSLWACLVIVAAVVGKPELYQVVGTEVNGPLACGSMSIRLGLGCVYCLMPPQPLPGYKGSFSDLHELGGVH